MSPFCNLTSLSSVDIKKETNSPLCDICERQKSLISCRKMNFLLKFFNS